MLKIERFKPEKLQIPQKPLILLLAAVPNCIFVPGMTHRENETVCPRSEENSHIKPNFMVVVAK